MCSTGGLILSYLGVRPITILLAKSELSPRPKKSSLGGILDFLFISQNNDSAGIDSTASLQRAGGAGGERLSFAQVTRTLNSPRRRKHQARDFGQISTWNFLYLSLSRRSSTPSSPVRVADLAIYLCCISVIYLWQFRAVATLIRSLLPSFLFPVTGTNFETRDINIQLLIRTHLLVLECVANMPFKPSQLWTAPVVNPINRKAQSIPILNPFDRYGRTFFFTWIGFMVAFLSW